MSSTGVPSMQSSPRTTISRLATSMLSILTERPLDKAQAQAAAAASKTKDAEKQTHTNPFPGKTLVTECLV